MVKVPDYRFRGLGFDSAHYQIFWEIVVLERGPLGLVSTIEELLGTDSSGSGLKSREYGRGDPLRWPRDTLYPQLVLTSPTSGCRSVGIVRSRTQATEFVLFVRIPKWERTERRLEPSSFLHTRRPTCCSPYCRKKLISNFPVSKRGGL
jgi:hypothetical protein